MANAIAYANKQIDNFSRSLTHIQQIIKDNPTIFEGVSKNERKRMIGYLITQDDDNLETEEIFADDGGEVKEDG